MPKTGNRFQFGSPILKMSLPHAILSNHEGKAETATPDIRMAPKPTQKIRSQRREFINL